MHPTPRTLRQSLGLFTLAFLTNAASPLSQTVPPAIATDTTPPSVTCSVRTSVLWAPDHKFADIGLTLSAIDDEDPAPRTFVQVYSNEDDDETGNGNFSPDARTVPPQVLLRAERASAGRGRVYLIVVTAVDGAGNSARAFCTVVVPHDQSDASLAEVRQVASQVSLQAIPPSGYFLVGDGPDSSKFLISIASPVEGSSFAWGSSIALSGSVNFAASKVEYYDGFLKVGEAATPPFSYLLSSAGPGYHVVEAIATNSKGERFSSNPVTFLQRPNLPPAVQLVAPASNSVVQAGQALELKAEASDSDGSVTKVEFFAGATKVGEKTGPPYSLVWNATTPGTYALAAVATDTAGARTTSANVTVVVNAPPAVAITSPGPGAVFVTGQGITLTVDAVDPDGTVQKVEFYAGTNRIRESTINPFTVKWTGALPGTYALVAVATDSNLGTAVSAPINIQVQEPPPPPPSPTPSPVSSPSANPRGTPPPPVSAADLSASRISSAELSLSWVDRSAGTSSFRVLRSGDGGQSWTVLDFLGPGVTSVTDPASPEAAFYIYQVVAYNSQGVAPPSNQTSSVGTDPTIADTDLDGVMDLIEAQNGTDPRNPDSDQDGIGDGEDLNPTDARFALRRLPAPHYAVIEIDPGPVFSTHETIRLNNLGSVVRSIEFNPLYFPVQASAQSWFYKDGSKTFIPALNDASGIVPGPGDYYPYYCRITGLNDLDQVVGTTSYSYDPLLHAFHEGFGDPGHAVVGFGGGGLTDLGDSTVDNGFNDSTGEPTIDGSNKGRSSGFAINNRGTVLGSADTFVDVDPPSPSQPDISIVRSGDDQFTVWGGGAIAPGGYPFSLNDRGELVGITYAPATPGYLRAGYWRDGIEQILPALFSRSESIAYDISQAGYVVGTEYRDHFTGATDAFPFIWREGLMQPLNRRTLFAEAQAINDKGQAVGVGRGFGVNAGFLWQNFEAFNLNTCIDPSSGWAIGSAYDINDNGMIAARVYHPGEGDSALALLVPVRFEAQEDKINQGYDPMPEEYGELPWSSVVKGCTRNVVKLVIPWGAERMELAVVHHVGVPDNDSDYSDDYSDEGPVEVSVPAALHNGDNDLTITGLRGTDEISTATIEVRLPNPDGTYQVCARLRVMALPPRTVSLGIYRIADDQSPDTGAPPDRPTNAEIKDELNDIFAQAGVTFQMADAATIVPNVHFDSNRNGLVDPSETDLLETLVDSSPAKLNVVLANKSGIPLGLFYVRGFGKIGRSDQGCVVFTYDSGGNARLITAHELGHLLGLSTLGPTDNPNPNYNAHDPGPYPLGTESLMRAGDHNNRPGRWLAQQDWRKANESAGK